MFNRRYIEYYHLRPFCIRRIIFKIFPRRLLPYIINGIYEMICYNII